MAKKKAAAPKPRRKTQEHLPTMEPEKIPAIHNAAIDYEEARAKHKAATKIKNAAEDKLIEAMKKHEKHVYVYGDVSAEHNEKDTVKVRIKSATAADDDDGDEE